MALCVHPDFVYVKARDPATKRVYIVAESRLKEVPGAVPKPKKAKKGAEPAPQEGAWQVRFSTPLESLACTFIGHHVTAASDAAAIFSSLVLVKKESAGAGSPAAECCHCGFPDPRIIC